MNQKILKSQQGFTILEILIAVALSLFLLTGIYDIFITQQRTYSIQDQTTESMQNVRVGLDFIARDIRIAGYDPLQSDNFGMTSNAYTSTSATAGEIYFTIDDNEDGVLDNNADEKKGYKLVDDDGDGKLDTLKIDMRGAGWQPLAENITALAFTYTYSDGETSDTEGLPDNTDGDTSNNFEDIRLARISLTARTEKEDRDFTTGYNLTGTAADGTCRTRTLTAYVKPRNIGL